MSWNHQRRRGHLGGEGGADLAQVQRPHRQCRGLEGAGEAREAILKCGHKLSLDWTWGPARVDRAGRFMS